MIQEQRPTCWHAKNNQVHIFTGLHFFFYLFTITCILKSSSVCPSLFCCSSQTLTAFTILYIYIYIYIYIQSSYFSVIVLKNVFFLLPFTKIILLSLRCLKSFCMLKSNHIRVALQIHHTVVFNCQSVFFK